MGSPGRLETAGQEERFETRGKEMILCFEKEINSIVNQIDTLTEEEKFGSLIYISTVLISIALIRKKKEEREKLMKEFSRQVIVVTNISQKLKEKEQETE